MSDIEFANGFYFNEPNEKAPDFVLGSVSIKPQAFIDWLSEQTPSEKGYVRLAIKRSREGKIYASLDNWQPTQKPAPVSTFDDDDSIPF